MTDKLEETMLGIGRFGIKVNFLTSASFFWQLVHGQILFSVRPIIRQILYVSHHPCRWEAWWPHLSVLSTCRACENEALIVGRNIEVRDLGRVHVRSPGESIYYGTIPSFLAYNLQVHVPYKFAQSTVQKRWCLYPKGIRRKGSKCMY